MNFKNIDFKSININKYIDMGVLSAAAVFSLLGDTNGALLGIIIYLTGTVLTRDSK